jgi:hypothetical protein
MNFYKWMEEYGLKHEPNFSEHTLKDCHAAWQAGYEAGRNAPLVKTYTGGVPHYCLLMSEQISSTPSQEPVARVNRQGFIVEMDDIQMAEGTLLYMHPSDAAAQIAELKALNARMLVEYEQRMEQIAKLEERIKELEALK